MTEFQVDDYDFIFSHQTHNENFALEFGKLIVSIDKWLGALGILTDASMLFSDLHDHVSFSQWLTQNSVEIADLRFEQGVVSTFLMRKYREDVGDSERTPKIFIHVTPVGFGFNSVSTLADAIVSSPDGAAAKFLDPSNFRRVSKEDGGEYDQIGTSLFSVDLGSKELRILHEKDTRALFSEASDIVHALGEDVIAAPENPSAWLSAMQDSYNNVKNLISSVSDFDTKQALERMYRDNSLAFDRIQNLETAFAKEVEKAKKYHFMKAVVGFAQLGLAIGNYVQDLDIAEAEAEQAKRLEGKLDDLKNEVSSLKQSVERQSQEISDMKLDQASSVYVERIVPQDQIENFSELSLKSYNDEIETVERFKRTTFEVRLGQFGFSFSRTEETN